MSTIRAGTTTTTALTQTGDTTGNLVLTADSGVIDAATGTTGALTLPKGTTAQRPGTPVVGQQRWNTTIGAMEAYNGSAWAAVGGGTSWQAIQTGSFAPTAGNGYPINTTSTAITATLPASPTAGDTITFVDYANTFSTNNFTIDPNGGKIRGYAGNSVVSNNGASVTLTYIDSTQGWLQSSGVQVPFVGGYTANYLVVAGGGGGGGGNGGGGGGGAGGLLASSTVLTPGVSYTIIVGGGGAAVTPNTNGNPGTGSSISTIASAIGGGYGGRYPGDAYPGGSGGSGGGTGGTASGGTGTPGSGTAGQGYAGGRNLVSSSAYSAGGGGGAGAIGNNGVAGQAGNGGIGAVSSITGAAVYYAGGGGGGTETSGYSAGSGGTGGGANGGTLSSPTASSATANTGGGGGGGGASSGNSGSGGSGTVIISYASPTQRGTGGTVTSYTSGVLYWVHTFNSSGTYVA